MRSLFESSSLLERVSQAIPPVLKSGTVPKVFLVGGAVRDALLGRESHDLDFVLQDQVLEFARKTANALHGAYYPLDEERQTARVILQDADGKRSVLDFAAFRGPDLESDLRARDFTINAIAVPLGSSAGRVDLGRLIDPLQGAADLRVKRLRSCSPTSLKDDPLRTVRAVRLANSYGLLIDGQTRREIRSAAPDLIGVSAERKRDELFRILSAEKVTVALRTLDALGVLPFLLPALETLKGVTQPPPHRLDVWEHTLSVVQNLEHVLAVLAPVFDAEKAASLSLGLVSMRLGRYREQITAHLGQSFTPDRTDRSLLFFAALYHDSGKPGVRSLDAEGRMRFFDHERVGEKLARKQAHALHLSNEEVERVSKVVLHHMRPLLLAQTGAPPSPRAIYRFFSSAGPAGVDVCLLSLADVMGAYGAALPAAHWGEHLDVVRALFEGWWEQREEKVQPPVLVDGRELMEALDLEPGPEVGRLLEAIREAQAVGEVHTREEALDWIRKRRDSLPDGEEWVDEQTGPAR